jgi:hypothetical protein
MKRAASLSIVAWACLACAQTPPRAESWPFEPKRDDFSPTALLDLRSLNEKVAGDSGYVKADASGDFTTGDGKPLRFWAVNTGVAREKPWVKRPLWTQTEPDLARHARFLAKRGVNLVRMHSQMSPDTKRPNITDIDESERDWMWRTVAAMKKEGIYSCISPYWGVPMKFSASWGVPGGTDQSALGLLFFDPTLQKGYKAWLRALFAEKNPYTGIPLAQDPSLAIIQIQNEDSLLFWTVNGIKGEQRKNIGRLYGNWLKKKYGTLTAASQAWQGANIPGDDLAGGIPEFYNIWEMTQPRQGGMAKRLTDQAEFWTRTMYDFNKSIAEYLRKDLGCKQLINAGNWKTANTVLLGDLERWSYTANEVDAVNHYFGGIHRGPNEGWAIVNGDKFTSPSVLLDPKALPINLKQTVGRPIMVTESSWVMPTGFSAEGPFLIAAYQGLTGVDAYFWFATNDDEWTHPQSANGYMPSQGKWLYGNPDMLGTFPAAALMYRMGYVKRGSPVVVENRALADMWARKTPVIGEEASFDPNRDAGDIAVASSVKAGVSPLAFLMGPVQVRFDADPSQSRAANIGSMMVDGEVRSVTNELAINSDKGYATVNTPSAQGVTAFFTRKPTHALTDVTFSSRNAYGAALAVSMDGKPLKSSGKILVQYGTQSRPTGWVERATEIPREGGAAVPGFEVVNFGRAPWQVKSADMEVIVKNPGIRKGSVLDMNGNAASSLTLQKLEGGVRFKFPENAMYVVLES